MGWTKAEPGYVPPKIDTTKPNIARIYDYWLGGKDNFEADRVAAEQVLAQMPGQRRSALENRRFLRRAVRFLAGEAGIDQFLDIGVGLPTQGAVHEVAHEVNPSARVAYVDYDPVVVSHGNARLATPDRSVVVQEDIRRPRELLANPVIRGHLDFSRPVALTLLAILRATAPRLMSDGSLGATPVTGRHSCFGTRPGSSSSKSPKNLRICSVGRGKIRSPACSYTSIARRAAALSGSRSSQM